MGILFALLALISWGIGDFFIQRSTRKFGDWITLFFISAFGSLILIPFVIGDVGSLLSEGSLRDVLVLCSTSILILVAALCDFEALKKGKIAVIEPVNAFEVVVTVLLAAVVIREYPNLWQTVLLIVVVLGILLVSARSLHHFKHVHLEKGVRYALTAMFLMGTVNFLFGVGSRLTSPLLINWVTSLFLFLVTLGYLAYQSRLHEIADDWRRNYAFILGMSLVDNLAWVAYAYSALFIPIAIATGISESYIAMAAVLGIVFNREKLKKHQVFGLALVVSAVIILSVVTEK